MNTRLDTVPTLPPDPAPPVAGTDLVDDQAEAFLAFPQSLFLASALREIARDLAETAEFTLLVVHRGDGDAVSERDHPAAGARLVRGRGGRRRDFYE